MDPTPTPHGPLARSSSRRGASTLLGGLGLGTLVVACAPTNTTETTGSSSTSTTTSTAAGGSCSPIPEETAGPYPGDGSNGVNVLDDAGIVRRDIRSSFGSATATATGVPLEIELTVVDTADGCTPLEGAAVYLWHCDIDGRYSLYSQGIANENYLRGVQVADASGLVRFTSIFPAAYSGRWPHIHFEVYAGVADATGGGMPLATSQLALPEDVCRTVYATAGYESSVTNLSRTSLRSDNVFSDGVDEQLATMTGSVADGYTAALSVGV